MSRGLVTGVGAVVFASVGFFVAASVSAWRAREAYADPWRKMRVEQAGVAGKPSRTRIVFQNPALAVQSVEVTRSADGAIGGARAALRDGNELVIAYDGDGRAISVEGPDRAQARFEYEGKKTRVAFVSASGADLGSTLFTPPGELAVAGKTARVDDDETRSFAWLTDDDWLVKAAHAEDAPSETTSLTREVPLVLDLRLAGKEKPGRAELEVTCAPFPCVPNPIEVSTPGSHDERIVVTGTAKRATLGAGSGPQAYETEARDERKYAQKSLPFAARVVATLGTTAVACRSLDLALTLCIDPFARDPKVAGGAIRSIVQHAVDSDRGVLDERARLLDEEERTRQKLDQPARIELCANRDGFARACTTFAARPFAATPPSPVAVAIDMRRGVGGTLVGSFVVSQSDGADCKFSPSPRTGGTLRLAFDDEKATVTASGSVSERGARPELSCSLGTANMAWTQSYTLAATQTFSRAELEAGGKLQLRLTGTMSGNGTVSFSNCRSGGATASCPGGRNEGYGYPIQIVGVLDTETRTGSGQIVVQNAPLSTSGTWRVPAEAKP